jgi:hypothetical protein
LGFGRESISYPLVMQTFWDDQIVGAEELWVLLAGQHRSGVAGGPAEE